MKKAKLAAKEAAKAKKQAALAGGDEEEKAPPKPKKEKKGKPAAPPAEENKAQNTPSLKSNLAAALGGGDIPTEIADPDVDNLKFAKWESNGAYSQATAGEGLIGGKLIPQEVLEKHQSGSKV